MLELLYLILGLIGLVFGANLIIKGSLNIAEHFKISHLFIGLTILAIGTDLPELFVAITGSIHRLIGLETSGLVVGNSLGSCFGQIALTLGILGLFGALSISKKKLKRDGLMMVGTVILLFLVAMDGKITRIEGIMFILIYALYFLTLVREEKLKEKIKRTPKMYTLWAFVSLIAGFAILIFCSEIVVKNSVKFALSLGISQSLVGILILGLGTSLPELVVSFEALRKKAVRLSIGNLIGSNIFDVLIPIGLGSTIAGLNIERNLLRFDIPFLFFVSLLVVFFFRRKMNLNKKEAMILIAVYAVYVILKIFRIF